MRILLVGNANLKHRGERYYDPAVKLANGFTRNGHHVYFLSDRDLVHEIELLKTPGLIGSKAHKIKHCSRVFLQVCKHFKPQMIVFSHADLISLDAVLEARALLPATRIAQFNVDLLYNPHNVTQIASKLDGVDATFITTAGEGLKRFSRPGKRVCFVPNMVDASIEWPRCFDHKDQPNDVFWALRALKGSVEGDRRIDYPIYLEANGVKIDYYGMNGRPLLFDARYFEAIANAKMGINISQIWTRGKYTKAPDEDLYLYSSDRIAHYVGSGLLVFTTRDNKLEELFAEDKEAVFFDSKEELLDKIRHYSANDEARQKIARGGWEKAHREFNERLVAQFIAEITWEKKLSYAYAWPTTSY